MEQKALTHPVSECPSGIWQCRNGDSPCSKQSTAVLTVYRCSFIPGQADRTENRRWLCVIHDQMMRKSTARFMSSQCNTLSQGLIRASPASPGIQTRRIVADDNVSLHQCRKRNDTLVSDALRMVAVALAVLNISKFGLLLRWEK